MHRTIKVRYNGNTVCGSQRDKDKIVAWKLLFIFLTLEKPSKETSLLGSQIPFMGVLSDDFATVDFREELCYHSRPKEAKFKVI